MKGIPAGVWRWIQENGRDLARIAAAAESIARELIAIRKALEEAVSGLSGRRQRAVVLDERMALLDEYLTDLSYLADRMPTIREYESVPGERTQENPLGVHTITPESFRYKSEERLEAERREAEDDRGRRWHVLYEMLGLTVTAHRDGTLEVRWAAGRRTLASGEPTRDTQRLPDPAPVLPQRSDSQR